MGYSLAVNVRYPEILFSGYPKMDFFPHGDEVVSGLLQELFGHLVILWVFGIVYGTGDIVY